MRKDIRAAVPCPSCGAAAGRACVAYVLKPGKTTGRPTGDVHAARWRAYRTWLARRA